MGLTGRMQSLDQLSVVIAAYNAAPWLERTLSSLAEALDRADISDYEVIVVDDGSSDNTAAKVNSVAERNSRVRLVSQENAGRLLARTKGLSSARHDTTLIMDARLEVFPDAFVNLRQHLLDGYRSDVWNGHVDIRYGRNLFAMFWGVVTLVGWRDYYRQPRLVTFGLEEFDRYPKGTTFLLAPTAALVAAMGTYDSLVDDPRFASDDTGVLRALAEQYGITISPTFGCWYTYGRSSLRAFASHTLQRGTMFIDSYLRPNSRFLVPLIIVLLATGPLLLAAILEPLVTLACLGSALGLAVLALLMLRVPVRHVAAFAVVVPLFSTVFAAGLWRGAFLVARTRLRKHGRS